MDWARYANPLQGNPKDETVEASAYSSRGLRLGSVVKTSVRAAMEEADRKWSDAWGVNIRGEYTSDGTYWADHGGRLLATRERGKWVTF